MDTQWGVGIVGCGNISGNHVNAIRHTENARLVAVCDIVPERAAGLADQEGVTAYTDFQAMLADPKVQTVHICTPHYLHAPMAMAAMRAGKHVLTEKPMAMNLQEAASMQAVQQETGMQLGICFQNRYNAATRYVEQLLESGELGQLTGGSAMVMWDRGADYYATGAWRGKWATEGGALMINQAIHTLDLLRHFTGEIVDVQSSMSAKRNHDCIETEDTCDLLMTTSSGVRLLFYASNNAGGNWPVRIDLRMEKGVIELVGARVIVTYEDGTADMKDFTDNKVCGKDYWGKGHLMLIEDFYRCLTAGEAFPIGPAEAMKTTRLLDAAYTHHVPDLVKPD